MIVRFVTTEDDEQERIIRNWEGPLPTLNTGIHFDGAARTHGDEIRDGFYMVISVHTYIKGYRQAKDKRRADALVRIDFVSDKIAKGIE